MRVGLKLAATLWGHEAALAHAAGISLPRLSRIIRGHVEPRPDEVARLAAILRIPEELVVDNDN